MKCKIENNLIDLAFNPCLHCNTECLREKPRDVEWNELNAMKLPLLLNYAQCKLLMEDYYAVIEHCSSVLEFEQGMK